MYRGVVWFGQRTLPKPDHPIPFLQHLLAPTLTAVTLPERRESAVLQKLNSWLGGVIIWKYV
jgi:hypothetical protein